MIATPALAPGASARKYTIPQSTSVEYLLGDHPSPPLRTSLGSTSITTDANGTKVSEMRYKPWGEIRYSWTSAPATTPAYELAKYTFTGQYSDSYINLLWYGSRHYDPALGRFIQPDTIIPDSSNSQGWDRYSYTFNNPVRYTDPDGHSPIIPLLIGIGVVALKVIDYGWTGYDIVKAGSVYLDADATPETRQDATNTILMAVAFELLEPDEATPGLPIDDVVRHGDDIAKGAENVISQMHHFATNKNKTFTPKFEEIAEKFGLDLDDAWNKLPVPGHSGRHPNDYHTWVLDQMNDIANSLSNCKKNCADRFIEKFNEKVIQPVMKTPDMLKKKFWEMME
jgi:RHS repeat-associated protein